MNNLAVKHPTRSEFELCRPTQQPQNIFITFVQHRSTLDQLCTNVLKMFFCLLGIAYLRILSHNRIYDAGPPLAKHWDNDRMSDPMSLGEIVACLKSAKKKYIIFVIRA